METDDGSLFEVSLPLSIVVEHIGDGVRCLVEGDEVVNAGHVIECSVVAATCQSAGPLHIIAFVLRSSGLHKEPHKVDLMLENCAKVLQINCTCPAGASHKCKHCIAVLLHINRTQKLTMLSSTDLPQSWGQNAKSTVKQRYAPTPAHKLPCCRKGPVHRAAQRN
ncbi:uncharacterized protein LOC135375685 [Ornithodoros turicata]|uniref:uncharacterized protein LOC135371700 n=1 Tax=Ornithodoros turicata TaxID=34597 RepID=UPI003139EF48